MQESIVFLVRVQFRRKEGSRSLSHLLMSFLFSLVNIPSMSALNSSTGNSNIYFDIAYCPILSSSSHFGQS